MRLDNEKPSDNIEDRRGQGGGFGLPRGGGMGGRGGIPIPMGRGGFSIKTIIFLVVIYFILKALGIDLLQMINGGPVSLPGGESKIEVPGGGTDVKDPGTTGGGVDTTDVTTDAGRDFVARVLGSTERVWTQIFAGMGEQYPAPKLVLFEDYVQSACGQAQSAMGPFYCPGDQKVYIDLSFYQVMRNKLGAPGDFAQAYVIAHEVGHHVQNVFGIAAKVTQARMRLPEEEANALQVRMELQADCFAGIWAKEADAARGILESGDIEEGIRAAAAIGDDTLQRQSQGYVVPESFTHGSSEQRVRWLRRGLQATDVRDCDTFSAAEL